MDPAIGASLIGVGGVWLGIFISEVLAVRREKRQQESGRPRLAGALAAELRGVLLRWDEIVPKETQGRFLAAWSAEEAYFSVFDNAGPSLSLLPADLAADVVRHYIRLKAGVDSLRVAHRLAEHHMRQQPYAQTKFVQPSSGAHASFSYDSAVKYATAVVAEVRSYLLPRLDKVADGK